MYIIKLSCGLNTELGKISGSTNDGNCCPKYLDDLMKTERAEFLKPITELFVDALDNFTTDYI